MRTAYADGRGAYPAVVLFPPRPPIDAAAREWVEDSLHLLASEFGRDAFRRPTVEPTDAFFPEPYAANIEGGRMLLAATADHLDANLKDVRLAVVPARGEFWLVDDRDYEQTPSAPRSDPHEVVLAVELDDLSEPDRLVGLFARELCGLRLQEEAGIAADAYDFGPLADLTAVYFGMGLFTAALPVSELLPGERMAPTLPQGHLAYALGHRLWHAGDAKPPWLRWLPRPVRVMARSAYRWLQNGGPSEFRA